jgi:hypothetical protein
MPAGNERCRQYTPLHRYKKLRLMLQLVVLQVVQKFAYFMVATTQMAVPFNSKGFCRWRIALETIMFMDFIRLFAKKNTFRKLDLFPSSLVQSLRPLGPKRVRVIIILPDDGTYFCIRMRTTRPTHPH